MKNIDKAMQQQKIKEGLKLLDRIELNLKFIFDSIKSKNGANKKAA